MLCASRKELIKAKSNKRSANKKERKNRKIGRSKRGSINGGSINGGSITGGSINGGSINGGSINGGSINGGSINGGSINGGSINRGSINRGSIKRGRRNSNNTTLYTIKKLVTMIPHINEQRLFKTEYSSSSHNYMNDPTRNNNEKVKRNNDNTNDLKCTYYSSEYISNDILSMSSEKKYKRILLIEKYTKYDNLRKQGFKDDYILKNFFSVYISHFTHTLIVNNIINLLRTKYMCHVSILKAYKRNIENIFITSSSVFSPDAIFSVGGDGTYLESAHIIANKYIIDKNENRKNKPIELVGINSDPKRSEGKLCLDYFHLDLERKINFTYESYNEFEKMYSKKKKKRNFLFTDVSNFINKLKERERRGIIYNEIGENKKERINFENANTINNILQNNSLSFNESLEKSCTRTQDNTHFKNICLENNKKKGAIKEAENEGGEEVKADKTEAKVEKTEPKAKDVEDKEDFEAETDVGKKGKEKKRNTVIDGMLICESSNHIIEKPENFIISVEEYAKNTLRYFFETDTYKKIYRKYITVFIKRSEQDKVETYKSINEVYIYEAIKNNICTYINIDNKIVKKLKSTALLITSGTGSTAWAYNVNKIDKKKMKNIIEEFINIQNDIVKKNIENINFDIFSEYINNSICFHPSSKYMKCIVKEPVENTVYDSTDHIYNCNYIDIKTCTSNTIVYIDGIYNIKIQPNDSVILYIKEDDFIISYK
ncbi:hypothetical protein, conserved [Plasmodium malariae]|uniref:NAD(+) kinase n=1 Tax=Plasmodium malariae TaxID=5858 RepID=A0A1A8VWJ5_PLAMA|nr:hypothetical protein, conserved [Plasmodium malariae]